MIKFQTIRQGQRVAVWNHKGEVRFVHGPRRLLLLTERAEPLSRLSAEAHQYLAVRFLDGRVEHLRGPIDLWFNPVEHATITVESSIAVDAHEALVLYERLDSGKVARRVLRGPTQYVPEPNEWLHQFRWHGADPKNPNRKMPRGLQFTKLRIIPDQMYFDVADVRTADDALLTVKLMVFFELADIERMLDQTHDPIADFINALSADIIDFASARTFDSFKGDTSKLNETAHYANLVGRAERIGYQINKVVYRGYVASDKLQSMHDSAIEARTALRLEAETERQAQELADLKLAREADREAQRRQMQRAQAQHGQQLKQLQHDGMLERKDREHSQSITHQQESQNVEIARLHSENVERLQFLRDLQALQVDLTRYLVAQYQHPDRLIRVDGLEKSQLHLHDN